MIRVIRVFFISARVTVNVTRVMTLVWQYYPSVRNSSFFLPPIDNLQIQRSMNEYMFHTERRDRFIEAIEKLGMSLIYRFSAENIVKFDKNVFAYEYKQRYFHRQSTQICEVACVWCMVLLCSWVRYGLMSDKI